MLKNEKYKIENITNKIKQKHYPTQIIKGRGQVRISRLTMERFIGRQLKSIEIVHHKNGNTTDNRIKNLEIVSRSEHKKRHLEIGEKTQFKKIYKFSKKDLETMFEMYKKMTEQEISNYFHCSPSTIHKIIWDNNFRQKMKCSICGEYAHYRKAQLCQKHYLQLWRKKNPNYSKEYYYNNVK